jgi:chitin-binding protein
MTAYRTLSSLAAASLLPLVVLGSAPAAASAAHGATTDPLSRAAACAPDNPSTARSAACRAAIAAGDDRAFTDWDNVRVPNVRGRDRQRIPDGRLCSGGLPEFRGLDLPRADWPARRLVAGIPFTFRYGQTIPHRGTFRLYVTKDGYDPKRPLRWSDLQARPFLSVTDPPLVGDAYRFSGRLPAGKSGRHIIYAIWQNSDTPDTYYSCSDILFRSPTGAVAKPRPTTPASPARATPSDAGSADPADAAPDPPAGAAADALVGAEPSRRTGATSSAVTGGGLAILGIVAAAAAVIIALRRRPED